MKALLPDWVLVFRQLAWSRRRWTWAATAKEGSRIWKREPLMASMVARRKG